jgi:hypothetical protein
MIEGTSYYCGGEGLIKVLAIMSVYLLQEKDAVHFYSIDLKNNKITRPVTRKRAIMHPNRTNGLDCNSKSPINPTDHNGHWLIFSWGYLSSFG